MNFAMNFDVRDAISPVLVLALILGMVVSRSSTAGILPKNVKTTTVQMPRAWLPVREALEEAHAQTGLRYAVVPSKFQGLLGPYRIQESVGLEKLLQAVAEAAGCSIRTVKNVVIFDPKSTQKNPASDTKSAQVLALALAGQSASIPALSTLAGDEDSSVRYHALGALHAMEGDFLRNQWPGRVSIFEVLHDQIDLDSMLFALKECNIPGSPGWSMAVDVLARAREPYLARNTWWAAWEKTPGTMQLTLWALGRSGDHTTRNTLGKRIRRSFTNDSADRYLAASALGMLNDINTMNSKLKDADPRENKNKTDIPEVRAAVIYGFALCQPTEALLAILEKYLSDADPRVRFMTCYTLGKLATPKTLARLAELARDAKNAPDLRAAALEGLAASRDASAQSIVAELAAAPDPLLRAQVADILGRFGGTTALEKLVVQLADKDGRVRSAAACSLATLGSREALAHVATFVRDPATDVDGRLAAFIGLGRGFSPDAVDILKPFASDPNQPHRLRLYAVLALANLANRAGQETLRSLTVYGSDEYLYLALRYLDLGDPAETFAYVKQYLARGFNDTSGTAACRLAELGYGPATRELLEGSDVFENHARMMHMWGAIRSQGPDVVPALVDACSSRRSDIRQGAALALGSRIDIRAVEALIQLTEDKNAGVRSAAAQSLGITGDPKAIPALIRLAEKDDTDLTFSTAIRALRMWAFRNHPDVKDLFKRLAGTPRDMGLVGVDKPSIGNQADHSFVMRQSAGAVDENDMCFITYESSLCYDNQRGRVVLWGAHGRRADSPQTGETWFYDTAASEWDRLIASREIPNETCCVWGTAYDPANQVVVSPVSGGRGGHGWINWQRSDMQYSLPWLMDAKTDQWYPARALGHKGSLSEVGSAADPRSGVLTFWYGKTAAYDAHANQWTTLSPGKDSPAAAGTTGTQFDPTTGRLIVLAADGSTWSLDPASGTWTDLKAAGPRPPTGKRMVYDSANHAMLMFSQMGSSGMEVWAYPLTDNKWEKLPYVSPCPHYHNFDVAYDSRNNVVVFNGGQQAGRSGETTVRETWTYRYKAGTGPKDIDAARPAAPSLVVQAGGKAALTWKAPHAGAPAKYRIYRGTGNRPWLVDWKPVKDLPAETLQFDDQGLDTAKPLFYKIAGLDGAGKESLATYPLRTDPAFPRWAAATVGPNGVSLRWEKSTAPDVIGYAIYRAPVAEQSYWDKAFNTAEVDGKLEKITAEPVKETEWLDKTAKVSGTPNEFTWPASFAYVIRPVNVWGHEGGASPVTLAVPDAPGPVTVVPWQDGRRLVIWAPPRADGVDGYRVSRMDDWPGGSVFRWHPAPLLTCGFVDGIDFPTADRRRYYVSGVDSMGTVGTPSSGAWSHGLP